MTKPQIRHALGLTDATPDEEEFRRAILDEIAHEMRLSPMGMARIPAAVIGQRISAKTGEDAGPDYFVRMKVRLWAGEGY